MAIPTVALSIRKIVGQIVAPGIVWISESRATHASLGVGNWDAPGVARAFDMK